MYVILKLEEKVIPKRGLTRLTENGAMFEDGSEIHDIDLVIFCHGIWLRHRLY